MNGAAGDCDVLIIGLIRKGIRLYGAAQNTTLREQDALVLEAAPNALDEFRTHLKLDFSDEKREALLKADGDGLSLSEVVVTETSRLNGKSVETVGFCFAPRRGVDGSGAMGKRSQTVCATHPFTRGYSFAVVTKGKDRSHH